MRWTAQVAPDGKQVGSKEVAMVISGTRRSVKDSDVRPSNSGSDKTASAGRSAAVSFNAPLSTCIFYILCNIKNDLQ